MITHTPTGYEVSEEALTRRVMAVRDVEGFRLEQTGRASYMIHVVAVKGSDMLCVRGAVLDALVDTYGINAKYDIEIT